jgi:ketosteroid isomerase-like protein
MDTAASPEEISRDYVLAWENAWNDHGVEATVKLYASDSVLIGYATAVGRTEIASLLGRIFDQGWTKVRIKVTQARLINGLVLVACEYSAFGSGPSEGKTLDAKSSHVLAPDGDSWLSVMHAAA